MGKIVYKDNVSVVLREDLSSTDTTGYFDDARKLPTIKANSTDFFLLTIRNDFDNFYEVLKVTNVDPVKGLLTFSRAHGDSGQYSFKKGSIAELYANKAFYDEYARSIRNLPIFAYRFEDASCLPQGWYCLDGRSISKDSTISKFIISLDKSIVDKFCIINTDGSITLHDYVSRTKDKVLKALTPAIYIGI